MAKRVYSVVEAAEIVGVHRNTLTKWLKEDGCPAETRADASSGIAWGVHVPDVFKWHSQEAVEAAMGSDGRVTEDEGKRRKVVAQAIQEEIAADEAAEAVVSRDAAAGIVAEFCQSLRRSLSNACSKIAASTSTMADPIEIQEFAEAEVSRSFRAAQGELKAGWINGIDESDESR